MVKQQLVTKRKAGRMQVGWDRGRVARGQQIHPLPSNLRGWLREIRKADREECRWRGEGYEDGEHIVFRCEKL